MTAVLSTILPLALAASARAWLQTNTGTASFTYYSSCDHPACGIDTTSGYTAAISQLTFGSAPGLGAGDACGRCFKISATADPYNPSYTGPFGDTIIVKVTDMCPIAGNSEWCGQTTASPENTHGASVHFDLCTDTGADKVFFPNGHGALTGSYEEVDCSQWSGADSTVSQWNGACLAGETAGLWPGTTGCGNQGTSV
ncbi:unnamed protein product [Peniophora sp. CBMAI 1063]|nr:unnamed protein product [Peniophora sp. CBMAI 1063]